MITLANLVRLACLSAVTVGCASTGGLGGKQVSADVSAWAASANNQAAQMAAGMPATPAAVDAAPTRATLASASLGELYANGVDFNPQIRVARSRVAVADAELSNAALRFFPALTGKATRSYTFQNILNSDNQVFQQGTAEYGTTNVAIEGRMPIINLENVFNYRKTDSQQRKSYVEYVGAAQTFIRDLMIAYIDLAEANAIIDEYRQRVSLLQSRTSNERARQSAGNGSAEMALGFEQELSDAQAQLGVQEARQKSVMIRIEELTGTKVGTVRGHIAMANLTLPIEDVEGLIDLALSNNPRYIAKKYEVDAFDDETRRAVAKDFGPTLDSFASHEYENRGGSQFGGGSETVQTVVGLQLSVPIFNAGGQGYQFTTAVARNQQISAELAMVASETKSAVAMSYSNYLAARLRIQRDSQTIRKGSELISLVNQRVADAAGTVDDGLQARLDLASYMRQRQQAQFQLLREWVQIKHLTGALSEADVQVFSGTNI
ncbi:TolC family protein [Devosia chinhatensis]|uniref:Channel protein TolC n=1 Tax=Devosia chinhatensis TaxID=429727 RepID=A0A0F5FIA3_9HYPH|nr:TolC family protein [Devosia chinhatensis]KKB08614.1 hypothetical protein VE26_00500 [Devosia chinhatensis]